MNNLINNIDAFSLAEHYRKELLENVIPFWMKYSLDEEHGGYYSCLDRWGGVYDTDKFIWLQGRQIWMFSTLYNRVEKRSEWLDIALHGALFLEKHGRDREGNWFFALNRQGMPIIQPYNIFSDCFATMAFGQLFSATGDAKYADIALSGFSNILSRQHNPKGKYSKQVTETRELKNFGLPMILCNLALEIEELIGAEVVEDLTGKLMVEIMEVFYQADRGLILENVAPDGSFVDCFDGRLLNPGHAIEAMWFIMDVAENKQRHDIIERAVKIMIDTLEYSWDNEYGGIFYFQDIKGYPPQQLDWDQKLWWVHIETLISLLKGYQLTSDIRCLEWYKKVHEYTWSKFPDHEGGEWYGYLNRRGEVNLYLKGGKWKGCFHVPRGLLQCWRILENLGS